MTLGLTERTVGPYTLRGISVGGVYTALQVRELDVLLDVGLPIRSFAGADRIFLSHGHADHISGLAGLLGIRSLQGKQTPPQVFLPKALVGPLTKSLQSHQDLFRSTLEIEPVGLEDGDARELGHELWVKAFQTHHVGPSLGYQFYRRVRKLKPEHRDLPAQEIARLRKQGAPLFEEHDRLELAYATDTLAKVLDTAPFIRESRVLIIECTYFDSERTIQDAQERWHLHLDELIARADQLNNEAVVLMHFSQAYRPEEVHAQIKERLPERLKEQVHLFAPASGGWFG